VTKFRARRSSFLILVTCIVGSFLAVSCLAHGQVYNPIKRSRSAVCGS